MITRSPLEITCPYFRVREVLQKTEVGSLLYLSTDQWRPTSTLGSVGHTRGDRGALPQNNNGSPLPSGIRDGSEDTVVWPVTQHHGVISDRTYLQIHEVRSYITNNRFSEVKHSDGARIRKSISLIRKQQQQETDENTHKGPTVNGLWSRGPILYTPFFF